MADEKITDELVEKIGACESLDELKALLQSEGIELSDELLDGIAGGQIVPVLADPLSANPAFEDLVAGLRLQMQELPLSKDGSVASAQMSAGIRPRINP